MRLFLGLLAVALIGADAPTFTPNDSDLPTPGRTAITYDVKILEMNGVAWRGEFYPKLQTVSHRGAVTVWTSPGSMVPRLKEKAGKILATPQLLSMPSANALVISSKPRRILNDLSRHADGPVNHASYVAYASRFEDSVDSYSVGLKGRKLDQGMLVDVKVEDKHITAVHTVALTEALEGQTKTAVSPTMQVPEYSNAEASGEWLIPNDGVLIIGLGIHTEADDMGKAVPRERLVLIEARTIADSGVRQASISSTNVPFQWNGMLNGTVSPVPMPKPLMQAPTIPARSLPQPFNAHGMPVPLPPLPDEILTPTLFPESSEPCASPQFRGISSSEPFPIQRSELVDPEAALAAAPTEPVCCEDAGDCPFAKSNGVSAAKGPEKPFLLQFPLPGRMRVEVRASVIRVPSGYSPPEADKPAPTKE